MHRKMLPGWSWSAKQLRYDERSSCDGFRSRMFPDVEAAAAQMLAAKFALMTPRWGRCAELTSCQCQNPSLQKPYLSSC